MRRREDAVKSERRRAEQMRTARMGIMLAAARTVTQSGYQATTMRTIAREAGYTASSLYTYFKSKEDIFGALRDEVLDRYRSVIDEALPDGLDFQGRVAVLIHRLGQFTEDYQEAIALHIVGGFLLPDESGPERMARYRALDEVVARWFETNSDEADRHGHSPHEVGTLFTGLFRTFMEKALLDGDGVLDRETLRTELGRASSFFFAALTAPRGD